MDSAGNLALGRTLGALGIVILILNIADFALGWNRIADWTTLVGVALALAGAYLEIKFREKP